MPPFRLDPFVATLHRDGSSAVVEPRAGEGPVRVDGFTVGAPYMTNSAPHRGELRTDGDELLYVISGAVDVILEEGGDATNAGIERVEHLEPGEAIIVPKDVWHRVVVLEPTHLVHITPGPGGAHRPL